MDPGIPAYHEAGHAVIAAVIVPKRFEYVAIKDATDEDGQPVPGCIKWKQELEPSEADIPETGWQVYLGDVMASLGGLVAQQIYTGINEVREGWGDREHALDRIRDRAGLRHMPDDEPLVAGIYKAALDQCKKWLTARWNQVENVAEGLCSKGRLSETQVRQLISEAMAQGG